VHRSCIIWVHGSYDFTQSISWVGSSDWLCA